MCPPPTGLVRPVRTDPTGLNGPTAGQSRGRHWRRTSQGFYVPVEVDDNVPEQRILEQSMRLPEGGAVTGWASLRLWGGGFFDGLARDGRTRLPVPLATGGPAIRGDKQVSVSRDRLPPEEVRVRYGIPCTTALRALFDAMRSAPDLTEAVVDMDMAAAAEITSILRMRDYLGSKYRWTGLPQVHAALGLASERSRSPNETRTRILWVLGAGLPRPQVNCEVFDRSGRLLGIADLLDLEAGVAGEFDGAEHRRASRQTQDAAKEDMFGRHRLEMFRVTGLDLGHPDRVVSRMLATRARALWQPLEKRTWTIVPPPWWPVAPSLDDVLDHRDVMREIHQQLERESDPDIRTVRGW